MATSEEDFPSLLSLHSDMDIGESVITDRFSLDEVASGRLLPMLESLPAIVDLIDILLLNHLTELGFVLEEANRFLACFAISEID